MRRRLLDINMQSLNDRSDQDMLALSETLSNFGSTKPTSGDLPSSALEDPLAAALATAAADGSASPGSEVSCTIGEDCQCRACKRWRSEGMREDTSIPLKFGSGNDWMNCIDCTTVRQNRRSKMSPAQWAKIISDEPDSPQAKEVAYYTPKIVQARKEDGVTKFYAARFAAFGEPVLDSEKEKAA